MDNRYNDYMKNFFYRLPQNFYVSFRGHNIFWHILAILLTFFLVTSGTDWEYFVFFRNSPLQTILFPALILGGIVPMFIPFILWALGTMRKNLRITTAAFALGQAGMLGWFISSCYKAFTGRLHPEFQNMAANATDISREFHFGFFREGIFWGWPSSHTAVAFATAITFFVLFPEKKKLKYGALIYAFYVGLGVSMSIHWFSDFVAGAIVGSIIGVAVGKSFLERLSSLEKKEAPA